MSWLISIAGMHPLLWLVPLVAAGLLAALGSRLSRRWMAVLAVGGIVLPLLQALAAMLLILQVGSAEKLGVRIELDFLNQAGLFLLTFDLTAQGVWAFLLCACLALAAQVHALSSLTRSAGRHRFHALVPVLIAAGGVLFTADSPAALLIGWEGMALAAAFLYAFWEAEQKGVRPGMRWLLFQRVSGLLLLLGLLVMDMDKQAGAWLVVTAACVRAGQLPFHGWVPESTRGPVSVAALVHGAASSLAAVFLIDRFWAQVADADFLLQILAAIGVAGLVLGALAGLQQQEPERALVWLFLFHTGLAFLGFAVGDPTAARILITAEVLVLGGAVLAVGRLPVSGSGAAIGGGSAWRRGSGDSSLASGDLWSDRRPYLFLAIAWAFPPSIGFVGVGRLMGSVPVGQMGLALQALVCLSAVAVGWMFHRVFYAWRSEEPQISSGGSSLGPTVALWALGTVAFALGTAVLILDGWYAVGKARGLGWATGVAGAMAFGWLLGLLAARQRKPRLTGRLTSTQRIMDRVAETGLGVGEVVVQIPSMVVRALGVIFWRGLGDVVLDTLILGSAVRIVEGVGTVLRYVQNGRIQRYTLVVVAAVLIMLLIVMR